MAHELIPKIKTGREQFHADSTSLGFTLERFWRWSVSDLVSNATRGRLAEFIVAQALRIDTKAVRDEWGSYDLKMPTGKTTYLKVEVKSAAYVQTWTQTQPSAIQFEVTKKWVWNSPTKRWRHRRVADVYVFALLKEKRKNKVDPLNVGQWVFYVLPAKTLNNRERSQHSITLNSLKGYAKEVDYFHLRDKVVKAIKKPTR
jgi:hypothetical protein